MAAPEPSGASRSPAAYQTVFNTLSEQLKPEAPVNAQAAAAAFVLTLLQQNNLPADLAAIVARLTHLLDSPNGAARQNACAALSACLESSDTAVQSSITSGTAQRAVALLQGGIEDSSLQLNLLVLLGTLCEASSDTAQLVLDAGGLQQLLAAADPQNSAQLQEAAADGLAKLLSSHAAARQPAAATGAVTHLAALLQDGIAPETRVRVLLCLGMLVGESRERQLELAAAPGAVAALLRLVRQQDDGDCQQIAAGLFTALATQSEAKEAIGEALRQQQAEDAATKFV